MAAGSPRFDALLAAARAARDRAYAPYSSFHVGAALVDEQGLIHAGCNVENAAYPQGQCAEATAIGVMVAAGGRKIREILVIGGADTDAEPCSPCGGCRQRLAEFAAPMTDVHLCSPGGWRETLTLGDLLPHGFGPEFLGVQE